MAIPSAPLHLSPSGNYLIERYKGYDVLDILIEMVIHDPYEFHSRNNDRSELVPHINKNIMAEALKFCDGGTCEINPKLTRKF